MTMPTISASIEWRLGIAAYGFDGEGDEPAVVVDRRVLRERVDEAPLREHPRRRGRHEDVADEADEVRDDQPVAEPGEALVVLEVDPEERRADDGELGQPVRVRGQHDEHRRPSTKRWTAGSKSAPSRLLLRRIHSPFWKASATLAVRRAARDLVGDVEADPDHELEGQMRPAAWQAPGCLGDEARHDGRF